MERSKTRRFLLWFFGRSEKIDEPLGEYNHTPEITVIVPAYNEAASIADTIKSIQAQTYPVAEIIVVDDCSSDNTGEIAESLGATVVRTKVNQGTKARAQNYVLPDVKTELFLTLDGDTMIAPDAIEKTIPYFRNPKTAMVCGMIVPQKISTIWERGRFIEYLYSLTIVKPAQNHNKVVFVSSGCFSVFRTEIVNELGGFESRTMAEDMDLTWAAQGAGYRVYYEVNAISYPVDPSNFKIYWKQVERWSRALLQNIKVRRFRIESWKLGVLIYWYLVWTMIGIVVVPLVTYFIVGSLPWALILTILAQAILVWLPAFAQVIYMKRKGRTFGFPGSNHSMPRLMWETLLSCFCFLITQYVNFAAFCNAVLQEWVLGRQLSVWHKGH